MSKKHKATVAELSFTFAQDNDCCDDGSVGQDLIVKSQDGGGGKYLVIETRRWAIDSIDEFVELLKQVKDAMGEDKPE
jgi:hypothetical protein